MSTAQIWALIALMGAGTFLIRFSFLGLVGNRPLPLWLLRLLRYTPVAVIPGMVAPLVLWPEAAGGAIDAPRLAAAVVTLALGIWRRNVLLAFGGGLVTLQAAIWLSGG